MATHKLYIGEFDDVDYELVAIHTSLEDYRLAYFLNQKLPILLSKSKNEIQITVKEGETHFSRYIFEEIEIDSYWNLIQNKNEVIVQKKDNQQNLFADTSMEVSTKVYLLPELKKVDFFLKIENAEVDIEEITTKINTIDRISAVYKVDNDQIKSKNNLIF
ncbi:IPExxxVDY family protein [Flavobacterium sp. GT3R68]|uniref:IPExxxVDY family protein n=1 Tax=Flavobacterium sp. GT3R68 TaxID=2594437 RepID=UPI000F89BAC1|nr:IPExxxVDY family protein [Flavobacterium sp. GT3R68]RTY95779.1 IPExxxVDY family protein [Flavobacterium sp. GSN2]TRW93550.1 IPExxxVDY family protein [Flavobacterium sp. GT3R68]